MRKIELIELVVDWLAGGDAPDDVKGRYHPEVIKLHVHNAFNALVLNTYLESKRYADYGVMDAWAKNYTRTVNGLSEGKCNVILPYPPLQLPDNMGIMQVSYSGDYTEPFAYMETNAEGVFSALEVSTVSTKPTFYLEQKQDGVGDETHVLQCAGVEDATTELDVKMIVSIESMDDYERIMIPAGREDMIIRGVIELLRGKPAEDIYNDNKANQI